MRGPVVTREYDALPEATGRAKIAGPAGAVWHRMGDCGTLDPAGQLWFCGRVVERVETTAGPMYTEPCEQVFRQHPRAARCALIGLGERGRQVPALVAETVIRNRADADALARELGQRARTLAANSGFFGVRTWRGFTRRPRAGRSAIRPRPDPSPRPRPMGRPGQVFHFRSQ